jgi:hypothetical protein
MACIPRQQLRTCKICNSIAPDVEVASSDSCIECGNNGDKIRKEPGQTVRGWGGSPENAVMRCLRVDNAYEEHTWPMFILRVQGTAD